MEVGENYRSHNALREEYNYGLTEFLSTQNNEGKGRRCVRIEKNKRKTEKVKKEIEGKKRAIKNVKETTILKDMRKSNSTERKEKANEGRWQT